MAGALVLPLQPVCRIKVGKNLKWQEKQHLL